MEDYWPTTSAKGILGVRQHCFGIGSYSNLEQSIMGEGLISREVNNKHDMILIEFAQSKHWVCPESRREVCLITAEKNQIKLYQKTWFFLCPLMYTKPSPLHSWSHHCCAPFSPLFLCMSSIRLCGFAFVLSLYSPSPLWTASSFPPAHSCKKALCLYYIFCYHAAPLEIRRPIFMHGFLECQLPICLWIELSMKEGWENQVFGQLCSFSTAAVYMGRGWNWQITTQ